VGLLIQLQARPFSFPSAVSPRIVSADMSLQEHRHAIDRLDAEIVRLLNERTQHVLEIGELKRQSGDEIYAPHREKAVLDKVCRLNHGPVTDGALRSIYREIMSGALALEKPLTIAYLGPEATYSHQAALKRFGNSLAYSPQKTIGDVFQEVAKGRADYGVIPIENSTEGAVTPTLDLLVDTELKIVAQIILPIQHCLLTRAPKLAAIRRLYVHPQSMAQCRMWIRQQLPEAEIIETSSNARSAELAAKEKSAAAIAGLLAAEKYRLPVLEHDIQDNSANATRFVVIGRKVPPPSGADRTSLLFSLADKAGALHSALAPFRRQKINMTKIESRPSKRKAWEYYFFADVDGHATEEKLAAAIVDLGRHCSFVKVLGSYPNGE